MKKTQYTDKTIVRVGNRTTKGFMGSKAGFPFLNKTHKYIYIFCLNHPRLFPFKDSDTPYWLESLYFRVMRQFYKV